MHTGEPTAWLRFFLCNLQCDGFGQPDPTDPSTYELPYKDFDLSNIKRLEDLPVFERGCDSSYSWAKRYRHLAHKATPQEIAENIIELMKNEHNPEGLFEHPKSWRENHLAFTGGEPMMHQKAIMDIIQCFPLDNLPVRITIETNGTQPLEQEFIDRLEAMEVREAYNPIICASISPKLFHVSGEDPKRAIKPEVIAEYLKFFDEHQIKPVLNSDPRAWEEFDELYEKLVDLCGFAPNVYVMPVGATDKGQEENAGAVAIEAMRRGFAVSSRAHLQWFGNAIGT